MLASHTRRAEARTPFVGLRLVSLVFASSVLFLGAGFYTGRHVGRGNCNCAATPASAAGVEAPRIRPASMTSAALGSSSSGTTAAASLPSAGGLAQGGSAGSSIAPLAPSVPPLRWPPEGSARHGLHAPLCFNTCPKAHNGVCDEGRQQQGALGELAVLCDLGTDCGDCGPWEPTTADVPWRLTGVGGPISRLVARQVVVLTRRVALAPLNFSLAYTDPKKDVDVSFWMGRSGFVEAENSKVFYDIFKGGCLPSGAAPTNVRQRGLFLDVGANFGWYSVMAASMGCRVLAFEPVPDFHAFLEYNLHANGLAHLADVRQLIVSEVTGAHLNMTVPSNGIWGTAGIGGLNIDHSIGGTHEVISVQSVRLDELVGQDALLMKMDVEGWEYSVMAGAEGLLDRHEVLNVIMEYSPGVHERHHNVAALEATIRMLSRLLTRHFSIAHIGDGGPNEGVLGDVSPSLLQAMRPMKEVTAHNLMYDLADFMQYKTFNLGCPRQKEVEAANYDAWARCNGMPEDVSPRSLHSVMGHNTNLWASKKRASMPLTGPVGLVLPTAPSSQFFPDPGAVWGIGRRLCESVPRHLLVRHRCACSNMTFCGAEEAEIRRLSLQGDRYISSNYVLPPPPPS